MGILANENAIGGGNYQIANSLRFNASSSQYLTRTFTTPTSSTIYTWSAWVKRGTLTTLQKLFGASTTTFLAFNASDQLNLTINGVSAATSTAVFRDPASWYHVVYTQNGSAQTIYVNNQSVATGTTAAAIFNTAIAHQIGAGNTASFFDGYMAQISFIDGQALTPSSFGYADAATGQWLAKIYTGTYGANGFFLPFNDGASTTTLGNDQFGTNDFTLTNFTRAAGTTDCWMEDVPSGNGSSIAGTQPNSNYCVLNSLDNNGVTLTGANLNATVGSGLADKALRSSMWLTSGKWYWEVTRTSDTTPTSDGNLVGVANVSQSLTASNVFNTSTNMWGFSFPTGNKCGNAASVAYGSAIAVGGVLGIAFDADNQKIWFRNSTGWFASGDPVAGTNAAFTNVTGTTGVSPYVYKGYTSSAIDFGHNFGQRSFSFTPPTGYKALCTANLPASTIQKGSKYMNAVLQLGSAVNTGANLFAQGGYTYGLVWGKDRTSANNHQLVDTQRGTSNVLQSNSTSAETTYTAPTGTDNCVAWAWNSNAAGASNTSGSITSNVSVSATSGFSIVTYTGTGVNATIGHGLGVAPEMIITKERNSSVDPWVTYHVSLGNTGGVYLNTTNAKVTFNWWQNTTPTSSVFSVSTSSAVNGSGTTYVAYCFTSIAGFSKFGSYTGNGSANGTFVYTGFRPKFVLIKRTSTSGNNWFILDSSRNSYNLASSWLAPDSNVAETTSSATSADFLSNGFKLRTSDASSNASGSTYIYMAFAENPFAQANAR